MSNPQFLINAYAQNQPLQVLFPAPIVAKRAPTTADKAPIGTEWVYTTNNAIYVLTSIVNNAANWQLLTVSSGSGTFSSLTVTPGPISLTGTTTINTSGSGVTTIGTGGTGAVNIGNATGNTAVTGSLSTTTSLSATTTVTAGTGITATTGNIVASTGNITATAGNIAASAGSITAGTTLVAGTGLTVNTGNATLTSGNLVLSTAATKITLPGPVNIMTGAGAPANGLAVNVGDLYINTTAATAATRIYVATAASTWTNVSCAA